MPKEGRKAFTLVLSRVMDEQLKFASEELGLSKAAFARVAIAAYLKRWTRMDKAQLQRKCSICSGNHMESFHFGTES